MAVLENIWSEKGYHYDSKAGIMYGMANGFKFVVRENGPKNLFLSLAVKNSETGEALTSQTLKTAVPVVVSESFNGYRLTLGVKTGLSNNKSGQNVLQAIDEVTDYLAQNGYVPCCEISGETETVNLYTLGSQVSFLTPELFKQQSLELDQKQQIALQTKENILFGIIGAFIGALLGVAAIVIIGQLGFVSAISGIIMGLSVVKGYELLARKFSTIGAIIAVLVMLLATYFAYQLDWAFTVAKVVGVSVFDAFPAIPKMIEVDAIDATVYVTELVKLYIFTGISGVFVIFSSLKEKKQHFEASLLI